MATDQLFALAKDWVLTKDVGKPGDRVIVIAGLPHGAGKTNLVKVMDI